MQISLEENNKKTQANFFISVKVLDNLKQHIPSRVRSKFVEEAIKKALRKDQFMNALSEAAGAWDGKGGDFMTDKFIRSLRESKRA